MKKTFVFLLLLLIKSTGYSQITKDSLLGKWKSLEDKTEVIQFTKNKKIIYFNNKPYGNYDYSVFGNEITFRGLKTIGRYTLSLLNDTLRMYSGDGELLFMYKRIAPINERRK